jgi:hypothetical protein
LHSLPYTTIVCIIATTLATVTAWYLMQDGSIKEMKTIEEIKEYGYIPS